MIAKAGWSKIVLMCMFLALSRVALAQAPESKEGGFQPQVGQAGKDVVWVPTPQSVVDRMLEMARVTPKDFLVDLGSGDGRTVITAAKRGVRAMGVEYNPDMVALSNREAAKEGVTDRVQFVNGDIFATDFSKATVVTLYLLPSLNVKLRPTILEMRPGTRVVSHAFDMGEWQADETSSPDGRRVYLWIVPARAEGKWELRSGSETRELEIQQEFQMLKGALRTGGTNLPLVDGRVRGDEIRFSVVERGARRDYSGRIEGSRVTGTVKSANRSAPFSATRR